MSTEKLPLSVKLVSKIDLPGHFTKGKDYQGIYDFDGKGWFCVDDANAIHWLSPNEENNLHRDVYKEAWIVANFFIVVV